jgi:L,D-peptidoglycan transpeptidase YkuD (ErfK/YbiS/YcfS/YnhG family)
MATRDGDRLKPTAGCVALESENLLSVLARCTHETMIRIRII